MANGVAIVPQFDDPADSRAIEILAGCADREIIGLPARDLVWGLGAFHCHHAAGPAGSERFGAD